MKKQEKPSKLPKQLHSWYLEATKELNPKSFNKNAQKSYEDLTDEQKFIDIFIAEKILKNFISKEQARKEIILTTTHFTKITKKDLNKILEVLK